MGPHWIKQWIANLAVLNEQFRDDDGRVDFEALGREEYQFRMALITQNLSKSPRAKETYLQTKKSYDAWVENGKKGGRPAKNTADAPTREDGEFKSDSGNAGNLESATSANNSEARESRRTDGHSLRVGNVARPPVRSSGPMPANVQKVYDFASLEGLDKDDAYECWYVTTAERDGNDADGNPVTNWKAFVRTWCNTRSKKRSA